MALTTYSLSFPAVVNEGQTYGASVTTTNVANGTTLFWTIETASSLDVTAMSGSFTINSNQGSFTVTTINDNLTEGNENLYLIIRSGGTTGPQVGNGVWSIIADTSISSTANPAFLLNFL